MEIVDGFIRLNLKAASSATKYQNLLGRLALRSLALVALANVLFGRSTIPFRLDPNSPVHPLAAESINEPCYYG